MSTHEDDSYGGCTICREYVPNTDNEIIVVPFPCPAVRLRGSGDGGLDVAAPDLRFAKALTEYGVHHGDCPLDSWSTNLVRCKCGLFRLIKEANKALASAAPADRTPETPE